MNKLRRFIESEMDARGWEPADLTRASGLSRQVVHNLLRDRRPRLAMQPRDATVAGLAKAFDVDEKEIRFVALQAMDVIPDQHELIVVHELREADDESLLRELRIRLRRAAAAGVSAGAHGDDAAGRPELSAVAREGRTDEAAGLEPT
jgi:transcriptional regulator with XRE-family HTH domain